MHYLKFNALTIFFSRLYRETLIREIGYQNVKQLSFYWQGGQCKPEYGEERFCSELIKYGAGNLEWLFSDNPLWTIVKYLLPKSGEINQPILMIYFLTDLIKFYCLMKLYEYKNIKIDLVLTEDIIPEDKLLEIIQSDDIVKLARKKHVNIY